MIRFATLSETGSRDHNEDSVSLWQNGEEGCFALADGLGGHGGGEIASRIAVDTAISLCKENINNPAEYLSASFEQAQQSILDRQKADQSCRDMKTTLVILFIGRNQIQWGHIGDSRLYYLDNGIIRIHTLDHSVPQMLVSIGKIREKDIRRHPDRNRLLRVIGVSPDDDDFRYSLSDPVARKDGQAFLLCSDGFWEYITEKNIVSAYRRSSSPSEWLDNMQNIVIANGRSTDMDNYSAIAVWIGDKSGNTHFHLPFCHRNKNGRRD